MKATKEEFLDRLSAVYALSDDEVTPQLKDEVLRAAKQVEKTENLYVLGANLSRYVTAELLANGPKGPKVVAELGVYLRHLEAQYNKFSVGLDSL